MSIWGGYNRKAEEEARKAGGIRVPLGAHGMIAEIITTAFKNMQDRMAKHNIIIDEIFLEEISIFEVRLLTQLGFILEELREKTKGYKVLLKEDSRKILQEEIKEAFGRLVTLSAEPDTPMEKKAMRTLRMLEDEIRFNVTFYVSRWKY